MTASNPLPAGFTEAELAACLRLLNALAREPERCDADIRLAAVREHAGRLMRSSRKMNRRDERGRDRDLLDTHTQIRAPDSVAPLGVTLSVARDCYVCRQPFTQVHFFYDSLCPECAAVNFSRRTQSVDLAGTTALLTGGRIKIGHQTALSLLRWGARVVVTTRFPCDAARRFAAAPDFGDWADRLQLCGLDMRDLLAVEQFARELVGRLDRLDVLVNNAAQTVRRPPAYYRELALAESAALLPGPARRLLGPAPPERLPASLSQLPLLAADHREGSALFPAGQTTAHGQPIDLRSQTSWHLELHQVELPELVEVHAVNCLAPFVLLRGLDPLWDRQPGAPRCVVNVSSMEGNFTADTGKTGRHPHTNMAKAAMNQITRTCAAGYARRGVFMNSVDPGWVSNEAAQPRAAEMARVGFREPLDLLDAAARILDPVCQAHIGAGEWGKLFKDYRVVPW